jgi:predicted PurR-regulated permease PerM
VDNTRNTHNISISAGTIIKFLLILLAFYVAYLLRDLVLVVLISVVIASAIEPATRWLTKFRLKRTLAVIVIYILFVLLLTGIFYMIVPTFINEVTSLLSNLPSYLNSLDLWGSFGGGSNYEILNNDEVKSIAGSLDLGGLADNVRQYVSSFSNGLFSAFTTIFGGIFSLGLIVVLSFYLSVQHNGVDTFLRIVTPVNHQKYILDLWKRSQRKIGLWMQGQLILAVVIAVLVYLGLTVLGVKNALIFALLAGLFEIIPVVGPILAAIPAIAVSFFQGGIGLSLFVLGFYIVIQQFENHLIYPLVVRKVVGVPSLLVILALIIGGQLAGFLGIILSIPASAVIMEVINDVEAKNRKLLSSNN